MNNGAWLDDFDVVTLQRLGEWHLFTAGQLTIMRNHYEGIFMILLPSQREVLPPFPEVALKFWMNIHSKMRSYKFWFSFMDIK